MANLFERDYVVEYLFLKRKLLLKEKAALYSYKRDNQTSFVLTVVAKEADAARRRINDRLRIGKGKNMALSSQSKDKYKKDFAYDLESLLATERSQAAKYLSSVEQPLTMTSEACEARKMAICNEMRGLCAAHLNVCTQLQKLHGEGTPQYEAIQRQLKLLKEEKKLLEGDWFHNRAPTE